MPMSVLRRIRPQASAATLGVEMQDIVAASAGEPAGERSGAAD
jgi:hypothetical protein